MDGTRAIPRERERERERGKSKLTLPRHDKPPADCGRGVFSAEDGDGGALAAHTDPKQKSSNQKLFPSWLKRQLST